MEQMVSKQGRMISEDIRMYNFQFDQFESFVYHLGRYNLGDMRIAADNSVEIYMGEFHGWSQMPYFNEARSPSRFPHDECNYNSVSSSC